jgi:hypothetical protein
MGFLNSTPNISRADFKFTHLHVAQHRCLAKHSALGNFEQVGLLIGVQHVQLATHKDEDVSTDLPCGVCRLIGCFASPLSLW